MTETKTPYDLKQWTVAPDVKQWNDVVAECKVVVLPEMLRAHFAIADDGNLFVNDAPTEEAFMRLWTHLHTVTQVAQIAMGSALVYAQEHFGEDFLAGLIETGELSEHTYRQRMSVARRVPPENRDPKVSFSKLRAVAPAPPAVQREILNDVNSGKLTSSKQVAAERRRRMREPEPETFDPIPPIPCPICGDSASGWDPDNAQWIECGHCHAHGDEDLRHAGLMRAAIRELYQTGDRSLLDAYVADYHVLS